MQIFCQNYTKLSEIMLFICTNKKKAVFLHVFRVERLDTQKEPNETKQTK